MSILPMDMDVGGDLILGWDCIPSHDLHNLFQAGQVGLRSVLAQLQLALLPAAARPPPAALPTVIGPGELRRLLCDAPPAAQAPCEVVEPGASATPGMAAPRAGGPRRACRSRGGGTFRGPGAPPPRRAQPSGAAPRWPLRSGTELQLATFCLADAELRLAGDDDAALARSGGVGGRRSTARAAAGMALVMETGDAPMPRSRLMKRLSERELDAAGGPARPRVDPGLDGGACGVGGVRAEARWDVAHLLRLAGPQGHQLASGGAAPAHRRAA
jgi:hypothetical protein